MQEEKREMNATKITADTTIARYESQITEERRKLEEFSHDKRQETQRKLEEAIERYKQTEQRMEAVRRDRTAADEEIRRVRTSHDDMKRQIDEAKRHIESINSQLEHIAQRERNKLAPYGRNMELVLADIARQQWYGQPPVGPLGQYVRVRDPTWAPLMRVRIGGFMSSFAITDARDRKALEDILKRHGKYADDVHFDLSGMLTARYQLSADHHRSG
jgi:structural maintenance of chromosomes protein 6